MGKEELEKFKKEEEDVSNEDIYKIYSNRAASFQPTEILNQNITINQRSNTEPPNIKYFSNEKKAIINFDYHGEDGEEIALKGKIKNKIL
jgi:hypothetical protein